MFSFKKCVEHHDVIWSILWLVYLRKLSYLNGWAVLRWSMWGITWFEGGKYLSSILLLHFCWKLVIIPALKPIAIPHAGAEPVQDSVNDILSAFVVSWQCFAVPMNLKLVGGFNFKKFNQSIKHPEDLGQNSTWFQPSMLKAVKHVRCDRAAQDSSAAAAVKQAWNTSKVARWSKGKATIDQLAKIHHRRHGNRGRDLANHMNRNELLLGCPVKWISGVSRLN